MDIYSFEDVINQIENSLDGNIDIGDLAKKSGLSVYEFRRIFSFVAKIPVGEYIRKRRMSQAALRLTQGEISVEDAALIYGYDSVSSFLRSFKEFHGATVQEILRGDKNTKLLSKISCDIVTSGGCDIEYSIISDTAFKINGFCGKSDITDTECCEKVWEDFYKSPIPDSLSSDVIYAAYFNGGDCVSVCIGERAEGTDIAPSKWACFKRHGTEDDEVNYFYNQILAGFLASCAFKRNEALPNLEIYPADMDGDFEWEIRIPII